MRTLTDEDLDMLSTELDVEPEAPDDDDTAEWPTSTEADAAWNDGFATARDGKLVVPPTHPALVDLYLDGFAAGLREQAEASRKGPVSDLLDLRETELQTPKED